MPRARGASGAQTGGSQAGIQSLETGVRLLQALAAANGAMSLKDLAAAARMPASKAHRYLVSFIRTDMVEQDPASGRYGLGAAALNLGLAALGQIDVVRLASAALADLSAAIDESALLAVWGNRGPTIIRWEEGSRPVTVSVRVGSVMPLLTSATGRVFAAYLPAAATRALIAAERRQAPLRSGVRATLSSAEIDRLLAEVRRRGLSRVRGDLQPGVAAFGAPVFDHQGRLAAAIAVLGQEGLFDTGWNGAVAKALHATAARLSKRIGHVT